VPDAAFLTNAYAKMAVSFLEEQKGSVDDDDTPPWETAAAAKDALDYFEDREKFELKEFEQEVLKSPETIAQFNEHRARIEEEHGQPLESAFGI